MTDITQRDSFAKAVTPRTGMVEAFVVTALGPGQQATTATHAKIATDYWLPLWSVNVAQGPGSQSRNHQIGAERPTRDFIVGRGQASQGAPKEMRWCINFR